MREDYNATIRECSKELSARERVLIKDTTNAIPLDEATSDSDSPLVISPDFYAVLDVHNEKSDNKDYTKYILVDKNGNKFVTGSDSFWNSFTSAVASFSMRIPSSFTAFFNLFSSAQMAFVSFLSVDTSPPKRFSMDSMSESICVKS